MTTRSYRYVILGGGLAAGYAAQAFVEEGVRPHELCILSAEDTIPYERPPLSKDFLAGHETLDDILINPADFYAEHDIDIFLNTRVHEVDFDEQKLHTDDDVFEYKKLMIATGATPRHFDLPGSERHGLFYLRRVGDSQRIREAAASAERAVVIGGGFIGMEVAAVLREHGLKTTMVFPEDRLGKKLFTPPMSAFFEDYYRDKGVDIVKNAGVRRFLGDGHVRGVELENGRMLAADLGVAGIGIRPNTELFEDSALDVKDGVLVNRYLQTNIPGVYAVGDVARYHDHIFDKSRRMEHWDNAYSQGQHAAQVMMGDHAPFIHVPYFFSDFFDLSYEFWGDLEGADQVIYRGDIPGGVFSTWWIKEGCLNAALVMAGRPDEEGDLAAEWIETREPVDVAALANDRQSVEAAVA